MTRNVKATDAPAQAQHAEIDGKDQAKQPAVPVSGDSQKESSGGEEDEGRKAEDIPDEEIKASMRQAEVRPAGGGNSELD